MVSRFVRFVGPAAVAVSLLALAGCAGSKNSSSGSDYSALESSPEASKNAKVEDARRSAEDAEMKAHQLREEKARNQTKPASN